MNYEYLEERFKKLDVLGTSGKNNTYLAKDTVTGQIVVMKYVSKENAEVYRCLLDVRHKNLVHILFIAEGEKDTLVVMEYISGKTLGTCYGENGRLTEQEALDIIKQLLEGLCVVHMLKLVHRDINPNNVLISQDGVVKIIDFDIGRIVKEKQGQDTELLGTAGFAAPEQFGFLQSDARTDIYGVGVILNVMLTGTFPHEYSYKEGKLGEIIQKCIHLEPELRYQSAEELLKEVQSILVENKQNHKTWLAVIPGFRTGKLWKELLASYYYISAILSTVMSVWAYSKSFMGAVLELLAVFLYGWVSVLGACNFLHWMDRLPFVRKENKIVKVIIGTLFWVCMMMMGIELQSYVEENFPSM